jgi:hypothetical protein
MGHADLPLVDWRHQNLDAVAKVANVASLISFLIPFTKFYEGKKKK